MDLMLENQDKANAKTEGQLDDFDASTLIEPDKGRFSSFVARSGYFFPHIVSNIYIAWNSCESRCR